MSVWGGGGWLDRHSRQKGVCAGARVGKATQEGVPMGQVNALLGP